MPPNVGGGSKVGAQMWMVTPHASVCVCGGHRIHRQVCRGGEKGVRRGRPVAGGECRSTGWWPCAAKSLLLGHPRLSAREPERERREGGRPEELRASCPPPPLPLLRGHCAGTSGCGRRRWDPTPPSPPAGVRRGDREALQPHAAAQGRSCGPHFGGGAAALRGHRGLLLLEGE